MPGGRGGGLVGEKNSLMRYPKPPKFAPQLTARRLFSGPFGTGLDLKKSFRLSPKPPPYSSGISGDCTSPRTFTGFSVRNCLRLDQNPSVTTRSGVRNLGTAEAGTGTCDCALEADAPGLFISGGNKFVK